jgi:hypothetical protein
MKQKQVQGNRKRVYLFNLDYVQDLTALIGDLS